MPRPGHRAQPLQNDQVIAKQLQVLAFFKPSLAHTIAMKTVAVMPE
jgi:hypothetical protein